MGKRGLQLLDVGAERGITINVSCGVAGVRILFYFSNRVSREFKHGHADSLLLVVICNLLGVYVTCCCYYCNKPCTVVGVVYYYKVVVDRRTSVCVPFIFHPPTT